jgi:hypothetical protein
MKYDTDIMQEFIGDVCSLDDLYDVVHGMINWTRLMMLGFPYLEEVMKMEKIPWKLILDHCRVDRSFVLEHCDKFDRTALYPLSRICAIDDEIFDKLSYECKYNICVFSIPNLTTSIRKLVDHARTAGLCLCVDRALTSDEVDYIIQNSEMPTAIQYLVVHHKLNIRQLHMIKERIHMSPVEYVHVNARMNQLYGDID